jgi:DNA-binding helix-hairpin-helix protein with protein kinase domain
VIEASKSLVFRSSDGLIELGKLIGEGGEGTVYTVKSNGLPSSAPVPSASELEDAARIEDAGHEPKALLAKIYKSDRYLATERQEKKIRALCRMQNDRLRRAGAWPTDILCDDRDRVVGFTMEHLAGWEPLYSVYQVKTRVQLMPGSDWSFLVRVARNLATCVHFVHDAGLVIGDLNESNVLVSGNAMTKLIDVDSFQVPVDGEILTVDVGKPELTPPELQGRGLDGRIRAPDHDLFALAVLLFQILVFGRHPFAGRPRDDAERTLEQCIKAGYYVFTERREIPVAPPPALALTFLPPDIRQMFEDAFQPQPGNRPSAYAWFQSLKDLEESLTTCAACERHRYWRQLTTCPWCALESRWRIALFTNPRAVRSSSEFDLDRVLKEIESIPAPAQNVLPPPLVPPQIDVDIPRRHALTAKLSLHGDNPGFVIPFWILYGLIFLQGSLTGYLVFGTLMFLYIALFVLGGYSHHVQRLRKKVKEAEDQISKLREQWDTSANDRVFESKREDYKRLLEKHRKLGDRREALRMHLLRKTYGAQLDQFLSKYSIQVANVAPMWADQMWSLTRYGITTAAQVTEANLDRSSIGPTVKTELLAWRSALEAQYWSTSAHRLGAREEKQVEAQVAREREEIEKQLADASVELEKLRESIERCQQCLVREAKPAMLHLAHLQAELAAYENLSGGRRKTRATR